MREPFLNETVERNQTKEASPATARQARYTTEKYSLLFSFCARRIFSSKRKRKLFCWLLLWTSRAVGLRFGRRAKIPSPRPPSFLPACLAEFIPHIPLCGIARGPDFFGRNLPFIFSRPCPAAPNAGDTKELPYWIFKLINKNPPAWVSTPTDFYPRHWLLTQPLIL